MHVLIFTGQFGMGHIAAAQAVQEEILRQAQGEITEIIVAATAKVAGVSVGGDSDLYDEFLKKAGEEHE